MVIIAKGIHLFPYRTQKLSLLTPMVLGGRPPGRLGNRQTYIATFMRSIFIKVTDIRENDKNLT
jgi:hypothetical protein